MRQESLWVTNCVGTLCSAIVSREDLPIGKITTLRPRKSRLIFPARGANYSAWKITLVFYDSRHKLRRPRQGARRRKTGSKREDKHSIWPDLFLTRKYSGILRFHEWLFFYCFFDVQILCFYSRGTACPISFWQHWKEHIDKWFMVVPALRFCCCKMHSGNFKKPAFVTSIKMEERKNKKREKIAIVVCM